MSETPASSQNVLAAADTLFAQFEAAWASDTSVDIRAFVEQNLDPSHSEADRRALITELVLVDLEFRWRYAAAGLKPLKLEDYVAIFPEMGPIERLPAEIIAEEYRVRCRWGDRPKHEEYISRFALPVEEMRRLLSDVDDWLNEALGDGDESTAQDRPTQRVQAQWPDRMGGYVIEDEIGRGGMGVVLRARDADFNRSLAVKLLSIAELRDKPGMTDSRMEQAKQRFIEEAQLMGQLQHPGIPPVHARGELPDGRPWFAMKLIQGDTLAELLKNREQKPTDGAPGEHGMLSIFEQICQTMAYAHDKGVLHRDLKPSNIMVGRFGEVQVMDWGLAKIVGALPSGDDAPELDESMPFTGRMNDSSDLTQQGSAIGTPAFMPPEQARGEIDRLDQRTDVFALGAILCVILTGKPPYSGRTIGDISYNAREGKLDDAFARLDNCGADGELATLAKRCLSSDKEARPDHASQVAEAVADYQAGVQEKLRQAELKKAQVEVQAAEELKRRRVERQRRRMTLIAAGLLLIVLLALAIAGPLVAWQQSNLRRRALEGEGQALKAKTQALHAQQKERKKAEELNRQLYYTNIALAEREIADGNPGRGADLLTDLEIKFPRSQLGWEWYYLDRLHHVYLKDTQVLKGHQRGLWSVDFSPDSRQVLSTGSDGTVRIWDCDKAKQSYSYRGHLPFQGLLPILMTPIHDAHFSSDGQWIASAGTLIKLGKRFQFLNPESWTEIQLHGQVKVWATRSKNERWTFTTPSGLIADVAFSSDGKVLAGTGLDGTIYVWDLTTGKERARWHDPGLWPSGLQFSPDGEHLASARMDGDIVLWNWHKGRILRTMRGHTALTMDLAFHPLGKTLASVSFDGTVRIWDAFTAQQLHLMEGHTGPIMAVAFHPKGNRLASGGYDKTVIIWDAQRGKEILTLRGHRQFVSGVAFSPDGTMLASSSADTTVRLWNGKELSVSEEQQQRRLASHPDLIADTTVDPAGKLIFTGSFDKTIKVWDRQGRLLKTLTGHTGPLTSVALHPNGRYLASGSLDNTVRLWDIAEGSLLHTFRHTHFVFRVAFDPSGRRLAAGSGDGRVKIWDCDTKKESVSLDGKHLFLVYCVAFTPDGEYLFSAGGDNIVKQWDVKTGKLVHSISGHTAEIYGLAFSPKGKYLASAGISVEQVGEIKLWDAVSRKELVSLRAHKDRVMSVAFSKDGRYLASGGVDKTAKIWEVQECLRWAKQPKANRTKEPKHATRNHTGTVWSVMFHPDGKHIISASGYTRRGEVLMWKRPTP